MANYNLIKRQQRVIEIIRKRKPTLKEIIETLEYEGMENFSLRTAQRDIEDIRYKYDLNIQFDNRTKTYCILDDSKSKNDKIYEHIDRVVVSESIDKQLFSGKEGRLNKDYVISDTPLFIENNSGIEFFDRLLKCCIDKKCIEVLYNPKFQKDQELKFRIYPLALKEFRYRWYLICQTMETDRIFTLALDRFAHLEVLKTTFKNKKVAKPNKLYEDVFGISIPEETPAQIIRIKTSKEKAEYLKTIPWHISQKIVEETKTFALFEFYLKPNYEFNQLILMQGSDVEVISPQELREEIKEKVGRLFKLYK